MLSFFERGPNESLHTTEDCAMSTTAEEFLAHADECVRLANLTTDDFVKRELLLLRQSYLRTANRLQEMESNQRQQ